MRGRLSETPWGLARFTFAYLGALIAAVFAGVIALVAYPIVTSLPQLDSVSAVYVMLFAMMIVLAIGWAVGLFVIGYVFRLGWEWACWASVLPIAIAQAGLHTEAIGLVWLVVLTPGIAAAITFARPDRQTSRRVIVIRRSILGLLVVAVGVWLALLWV